MSYEKKPCFRCGQPVHLADSVAMLEGKLGHLINCITAPSIHIRCSPSRAQFIMHPAFGEPAVDTRPEYDKRLQAQWRVQHTEEKTTKAWMSLQEEYRPELIVAYIMAEVIKSCVEDER